MSLLTEYQYQPNDIDTEMMLTEIPIDVLEENIRKQFSDPLNNHKMDYLTNFITKYKYSKEVVEMNEDEDEKMNIEQFRSEFITFMTEIFRENLDIEFPIIDEMLEEDQDEVLHFTYRFFIINIKHNFVNMILNYIDKFKSDICETLPRKKDISTLTFKCDIEDPEDVLILSNLNLVIDYILSRKIDVSEFLEMTDRDEPTLERFLLESFYDDTKVVGNFMDKYIQMINRNFKIEIESNVRNQILRKYIKYI
nr:MAG TPA: hypothetical protein [Caudoviricetes sp.]